MFKIFLSNIGIVIGSFFLLGVISFVFAWAEPSMNPPSKGVAEAPTPIDTSATDQTKSGNLTVNGVFNAGQLCIAGNCKTSWPTSNCQRMPYNLNQTGGTAGYLDAPDVNAGIVSCSPWPANRLTGFLDSAMNPPAYGTIPQSGYLVCCNYLQ